jgi:hypothetical protein
MEQILLSPIPLEELFEKFKALIRAELQSELQLNEAEKLVSPSEVCAMFQPKISKPTLTKWTNDGRLKMYRIGSRTFYKKGEVLEAAKTMKKYKGAA